MATDEHDNPHLQGDAVTAVVDADTQWRVFEAKAIVADLDRDQVLTMAQALAAPLSHLLSWNDARTPVRPLPPHKIAPAPGACCTGAGIFVARIDIEVLTSMVKEEPCRRD